MRRRILVAMVGVVVAALVLSGLGTIFLSRLEDREATERELGEQATALATVLEGVIPAARGPIGRERLNRIARALDIQGVGLVIRSGGDVVVTELPDGVEVSDVADVAAGRTVTGTVDGTSFAAARVGTLQESVTVVLTADPGTAAGPAVRWLIVAAAITLALATLIATWLSRTISRPVAEARDATRRIAAGDLATRTPEPQGPADDELTELLRSINSMAAALERSKGLERQFLLSISHDLRTPMTSIQGYAEALTDGAITDAERAGSVILAEARRLDRLIRDLLELARLDARQFTLHPREVDLVALTRQVVDGFPGGDDLVRPVVLGPAEPVTARVDADRYAQTLGNLLQNAQRYARDTIEVRVEPGPTHVAVRVGDDGPGIPPADRPHVLERLYVARHDPEDREGGTGLGLAIARELTEAMGGTVTVGESPLGGAELTLRLPRAG